ncbi:lipopolysaccharide biosynthesis protein [Microbacterium ureisolvens]|uniref:lipopolysaccharide biosynthesis protein n=1 Tax=Microbacterium ureisolvens TaxID=2781186 RepID=UPI003638B470
MGERGFLGPLSRLVGARATSSVLQFLVLIFIARSVPIESFGLYSSGLAVGAVASGVLGLGIVTRAYRIQAESIPGMPASYFAITLVGAALGFVIVLAYATLSGSGVESWSVAAGAFVATEMINALCQALLFGMRRNARAELGVVLGRAIPLAFIAVAATAAPASTFSVAAIGFVAAAVVNVLLLGRLRWFGWHLIAVIVGGRHYWYASMWSMAQQLDVVIINARLGPAAAGAFSGAFRLASPIHLVTGAITSTMLPKLTAAETTLARRIGAKPYLRLSAAYAAAAVLVSPVMAWVGPLLLGEAFQQYGLIFVALFINSAVSSFAQVQAARSYAEGHARAVAIATGVSTLLGLALVILAVLFAGVLAAAVALVVARLVLVIQLALVARFAASMED